MGLSTAVLGVPTTVRPYPSSGHGMYVAGLLSTSVVLRSVLANPKSDVRSFTLTGVLVLL